MNLIAKTFFKNVEMTSKIAYEFDEEEEDVTSNYQCQFKVEVVNNDYGYIYRWDLAKFDSRYQVV